ncbi:hypothetical protein [Bradyrhizobium pachyrhizi]|uniref:hypothetical protein n=1 Tax=Bradyrhizobium pachyrhizi TaxID=280333 RepID=UPI000B2A99E4|nr:hypothetical protein [Bradyrhizobium pachyrhizi]
MSKVCSFARSYTETAIKVLAGIMSSEEAPHAARVAAANSLLDRGWGKPSQPLSGDPENPINVVTRIELVGVKPTPPPPY